MLCGKYGLGGTIMCDGCKDFKEVHDTIIDWFIENILWHFCAWGTVVSRCKYNKTKD